MKKQLSQQLDSLRDSTAGKFDAAKEIKSTVSDVENQGESEAGKVKVGLLKCARPFTSMSNSF